MPSQKGNKSFHDGSFPSRVYLDCHWFVPFCKRTCEGILLGKEIVCSFYKTNYAKTIFLRSFFCNNSGRDGALMDL